MRVAVRLWDRDVGRSLPIIQVGRGYRFLEHRHVIAHEGPRVFGVAQFCGRRVVFRIREPLGCLNTTRHGVRRVLLYPFFRRVPRVRCGPRRLSVFVGSRRDALCRGASAALRFACGTVSVWKGGPRVPLPGLRRGIFWRVLFVACRFRWIDSAPPCRVLVRVRFVRRLLVRAPSAVFRVGRGGTSKP